MHCKKCDGLLRNDRGTERYTCECAADPASHRATRFMHARCATKPATDSQSRGIPIKMYAPIVPFQNATRRECEYENVIKNGTCHVNAETRPVADVFSQSRSLHTKTEQSRVRLTSGCERDQREMAKRGTCHDLENV